MSATPLERFMERVSIKPNAGCWMWTGSLDRKGYGRFRLGGGQPGAHRASYELLIGVIPEGLCVLHRCDVPACVNPEHLFLGTNSDNMADKVSKGRHRPGELHGNAKLTRNSVNAIREALEKGARNVDLAIQFGVTKGAISMVKRRVRWA